MKKTMEVQEEAPQMKIPKAQIGSNWEANH